MRQSSHFARKFDPQPFHVDEAAAKQSMFGGLIASGWHTCALAMRMMCDAYLLDAASMGSPGVEEIRWLKPVRPGDTLRVRCIVLEARPLESKPHVGLVRNRWEVLNQNGGESYDDGRLRHVQAAQRRLVSARRGGGVTLLPF